MKEDEYFSLRARMVNIFKFFLITLSTGLLEIIKVSQGTLINQISYYPNPFKMFSGSQALMLCNATSAMEAALFAGVLVPGSIVGTTAFVIPSSKVLCSSRDSIDHIIQFTENSSEAHVRSEVPITCSDFPQVLFSPFDQSALPCRWIRLKSLLSRWNNA